MCSKPSGNSAQGACDLAGNVWEWVADGYGSYSDAPTDGSARAQAAELRVYRGGSWTFTGEFLRAADRGGDAPDLRINSLGFRVARAPTF